VLKIKFKLGGAFQIFNPTFGVCVEPQGGNAFLKELIASTPNVSVRAKEFRRWIDENSPYSDNDEA
jgi:hypothetical protein